MDGIAAIIIAAMFVTLDAAPYGVADYTLLMILLPLAAERQRALLPH